MNVTSAALPPALQEATPSCRRASKVVQKYRRLNSPLSSTARRLLFEKCAPPVVAESPIDEAPSPTIDPAMLPENSSPCMAEVRSLLQSHSNLHVDEFKGEGNAEWWIVVSR